MIVNESLQIINSTKKERIEMTKKFYKINDTEPIFGYDLEITDVIKYFEMDDYEKFCIEDSLKKISKDYPDAIFCLNVYEDDCFFYRYVIRDNQMAYLRGVFHFNTPNIDLLSGFEHDAETEFIRNGTLQ